MSGYDDPRRMGFFSNSLIETRHLYMDPETFTPDESVTHTQPVAFPASPSVQTPLQGVLHGALLATSAAQVGGVSDEGA